MIIDILWYTYFAKKIQMSKCEKLISLLNILGNDLKINHNEILAIFQSYPLNTHIRTLLYYLQQLRNEKNFILHFEIEFS